ncbi:MAG TPA: DUF1254 domain-containing protein [Synechococcales cyanobacterium M55_K2018_004]|nr:DUF1254 domain-containing protein [Synechococcales cyanobacterium M55_K2018_004]
MSTEKLTTPIGDFEFTLGGYPTQESAQKLFDALDFQRACQAYLDFMPAMSMYSLLEGQEKGWGCKDCSDLAVAADLLTATPLVLTGNTESVYFACNVDLKKDGPTVVEIPPQVLGMANDAYFRYIVDFGMAGPDQGRGGKYLLLPPDYDGDVPEGYFVAHYSRTSRVWVMARASQTISGMGEQALQWYGDHCAVYPLKDDYRRPNVMNCGSVFADTTHPNDLQYFVNLDQVIQYEPTAAFAPEQLGLLRSLGIEKGKTFDPDERMKQILDTAAKTGLGIARAIAYQAREPEARVYPDRHWEYIFVGGSHEFLRNGVRNLDARTLFHFTAICVTPAMVNKVVGVGSQYMSAYRDADGDYLNGGKNYQLHLPPNIPVNNFWSVTLYDPGTRSLLQTDQPKPSVNSFDQPEQNRDGSYDIYFGPSAPAGKERNWVQTVPGKGWFTYIRLYGPLEPFFDQTWRPDDIVKMA